MKEANCNHCEKTFTYRESQSTGKWCSNKCQMTNQYDRYIDRWKNGEEDGNSGKHEVSAHIRRYMHEKNDSKCCQCGWDKTNSTTGKIPLHIDHIDGDSQNNKEDNLRLICPNCHSLTTNYGILNRGKGRYKRTGTKHPKDR